MSKATRKGRRSGATMMLWMFFTNLFEPKKVAAMEQIDTQRRIGTERHRGAAEAPPSQGQAVVHDP